MVADDLTLVEPTGEQVRGPAERPGHRLGLVVEGQCGEVAPFAPAPDLDHPGAELQPEQQPPEQHEEHRRRRLRGRAEEGGEEPGLAQQHLPAEAVEALADGGDGHVPAPHRQEAQHRHPRRASLGESGDEDHREDAACRAQCDQATVGVSDQAEHSGTQDLLPAAFPEPAHPVEERGGRQQAVFACQRSELEERGEESDEVEPRDAPLEDLTGHPEVHGGEPVHGHQGRRGHLPTPPPSPKQTAWSSLE